MKVTIILGVVSGLALLALASESTALAAGAAVSPHAATTSLEPAAMLLSGATLLLVAGLVRRYRPSKS